MLFRFTLSNHYSNLIKLQIKLIKQFAYKINFKNFRSNFLIVFVTIWHLKIMELSLIHYRYAKKTLNLIIINELGMIYRPIEKSAIAMYQQMIDNNFSFDKFK